MKLARFVASVLATIAISASTRAQAAVWRCEAWPALGGYYIFYGADWDRRTAIEIAMAQCTTRYGNTCYYRCYQTAFVP